MGNLRADSNKLNNSALTHTLLPLPVVPPINKCGASSEVKDDRCTDDIQSWRDRQNHVRVGEFSRRRLEVVNINS